MLSRVTDENASTVISNLEKNNYALKNALMMPIEEYVEQHPDASPTLETLNEYGAKEELFGLFIAIGRRNKDVFKYLWEEQGTLW